VSRLIIWRHGQTEWNAVDRIQGHLDVPLDDVGRAQAAAAASRIADQHPDAIVASDLRRAVDTAAALSAITGLSVRRDERLREQNFGQWQGLTNAEARSAFPEAWNRWRRGEAIADYGIEDRTSLARRALAAMEDSAELGGTVVVVTHGGTAKLAMGALLGWPAGVSSRVMGLLNCHWAELQWHRQRGGWVLRSYNVGVVPALSYPEARRTATVTREGADTALQAAGADEPASIDHAVPTSDNVPAWRGLR
jgi:glucosyl-3-phosphoglycerate phosphatase